MVVVVLYPAAGKITSTIPDEVPDAATIVVVLDELPEMTVVVL